MYKSILLQLPFYCFEVHFTIDGLKFVRNIPFFFNLFSSNISKIEVGLILQLTFINKVITEEIEIKIKLNKLAKLKRIVFVFLKKKLMESTSEYYDYESPNFSSFSINEHGGSFVISENINALQIEGHSNKIRIEASVKEINIIGHNNRLKGNNSSIKNLSVYGHNNILEKMNVYSLNVTGHNNKVSLTSCHRCQNHGFNNTINQISSEAHPQQFYTPHTHTHSHNTHSSHHNNDHHYYESPSVEQEDEGEIELEIDSDSEDSEENILDTEEYESEEDYTPAEEHHFPESSSTESSHTGGGVRIHTHSNGETTVHMNSMNLPNTQFLTGINNIMSNIANMAADINLSLNITGNTIHSHVSSNPSHVHHHINLSPSSQQQYHQQYHEQQQEEEEPDIETSISNQDRILIINSNPLFKYSLAQSINDQCVVCLESFKHVDIVRVLKCKHAFHKNCIDNWLMSKLICPLCKVSLIE